MIDLGEKAQKIWFREPANEWEEALPIGNGRLGGMVYGHVSEEVIMLNEDSVWYGGPKKRTNEDAGEHLPKIRQLLFDGELEHAEYLAKMTMTSNPKYLNPYHPLGELRLFNRYKAKNISNYERQLDLDEAIVKVSYDDSGVHYSREIFTSITDQVMVIHLKADHSERLSLCVDLSRRPFEGVCDSLTDNRMVLSGDCGRGGVDFACALHVMNSGGSVGVVGNFISIEEADEVTVILTANSTYRTDNPMKQCVKQLNHACSMDYSELRRRHIESYQHQYKKMTLELTKNDELSQLPTDERLQRLKVEGSEDNGLVELYFNFGRYLLIASSQPGTLPANLQGIWNHMYRPPWESKYTININIQMNYWISEVCNLSECHLPLFDLVEKMVPNGKEVAKNVYGCNGFVAHHNTNLWGDCDIEGRFGYSPFWQMGGAWLSLHMWEHYAFTLDTEFLKTRAYPVMKEACIFLLEYLVEAPSGELVSGPSVSPENAYILQDGNQGALCMGPAMDTQIIRELFGKSIEAAKIIGGEEAFCQRLTETMNRLVETKIGRHGQIVEWMEDYEEVEPGHRHMSQLFALHPGSQISKRQTPAFFEAAGKTIERRLENGGGHTGWSRAWIINFLARLNNSEKAHEHILELLRGSTYNNLFNGHPPFQIDGNFGTTAGIAEMLIQSHEDLIHILPALPKSWHSGNVEGVKARGGYVLDFQWRDASVHSLRIKAERSGVCRIKVNDEHMAFPVEQGKICTMKFEGKKIEYTKVCKEIANG